MWGNHVRRPAEGYRNRLVPDDLDHRRGRSARLSLSYPRFLPILIAGHGYQSSGWPGRRRRSTSVGCSYGGTACRCGPARYLVGDRSVDGGVDFGVVIDEVGELELEAMDALVRPLPGRTGGDRVVSRCGRGSRARSPSLGAGLCTRGPHLETTQTSSRRSPRSFRAAGRRDRLRHGLNSLSGPRRQPATSRRQPPGVPVDELARLPPSATFRSFGPAQVRSTARTEMRSQRQRASVRSRRSTALYDRACAGLDTRRGINLRRHPWDLTARASPTGDRPPLTPRKPLRSVDYRRQALIPAWRRLGSSVPKVDDQPQARDCDGR